MASCLPCARAISTTMRPRCSAGCSGPARSPKERPRLCGRAWSELRQSCPARQTSPAIDLKLAEHLLSDQRLYVSALNALQASAPLARNPAPAGPPERVLTGVDRALSSRQR